MLHLFPQYVAWHYYIFVFVAALGTIQAAAGIAGLRGLQIGGRLWRGGFAWGVLVLAYVVGAATFVWTTPDYLSPGLAGTELLVVFAAGSLSALIVSLVGGVFCCRPSDLQGGVSKGRLETVGSYSCELIQPPGVSKGLVIVLPDPDLPAEAAHSLVNAVLEDNFAVALVSWCEQDVPRYPDALAVVPMFISKCESHDDWGGGPIVVVGLGLAGDLALRAVCEDDRAEMACAVGPALRSQAVLEGLLLLREMSFLQAWRWARRWQRRTFIVSLRADEALTRLGRRAVLLVSQDDGFFAEAERLTEHGYECEATIEVVERVCHRELVTELAPTFMRKQLQALRGDDAAGSG